MQIAIQVVIQETSANDYDEFHEVGVKLLPQYLRLDYLHNGCKLLIVHRDLKTSNIPLNENMQAKITDFGLLKVFADNNVTHISTRPAGTPGYFDP